MHKVLKKEEIKEISAQMPKNAKQGRALAGDWSTNHTVASMVFDNVIPKAEVHENAFDVWFVLQGRAQFILGGSLVSQESAGKGEWVGEKIEAGETFEVGPGDVVDIPPGVAHQIDASGKRLETLIVKINLKSKKVI